MANDILEKGAIVQRNKETFAIAPHIPGGFIQPATLRNIADVAGAPSKARSRQLVKIQYEERLAATSELSKNRFSFL